MPLEIGEKLASAGYAVFGMDYEGHGRSAGVRCYITKFDNVVNDCSSFYKSICGNNIVISCSCLCIQQYQC
jgi:acylglycerol lipase